MTQVLWQGHEAECYILNNSINVESNESIESAYERAGMMVGRSNAVGNIYSTPDWPARNEFWQRFNHNVGGQSYSTGMVFWAARNSTGQNLAQIVGASTTTAKFQIWNGVSYDDVGSPWTLVGTGIKTRFDIHLRGGAGGQVEVWYGALGTQTKVVDVAGDYPSAVNFVRIFHSYSAGSSFNTTVAHSIVQTTSTLSSTSEIKPPTSNGADVDGTGTWANVDEFTYSDVDVITLSSAGQRQSFKANARTNVQAVVTGVTASCRAWYETGGPTGIRPYLTISGIRYYGDTIALDVVAKGYQYTWSINPATGTAFTTAEASAATLEWGWEAI